MSPLNSPLNFSEKNIHESSNYDNDNTTITIGNNSNQVQYFHQFEQNAILKNFGNLKNNMNFMNNLQSRHYYNDIDIAEDLKKLVLPNSKTTHDTTMLSRQQSSESMGDVLISSYDISDEILNTYDSYLDQNERQSQFISLKKNYRVNSTSRSIQTIDSQSLCLTPVSTQSTENDMNKSFFLSLNKDNSLPKLLQQFPPSLPNSDIEFVSQGEF